MKRNILYKYSPVTNEILYEIPVYEKEDVDRKCKLASQMFEEWSKTSVEDRKKYLLQFIDVVEAKRERIVNTIIKDTGKTWLEADTEVTESCDIIGYLCREKYKAMELEDAEEITLDKDTWPQKKAYIFYQPKGVFAVIKPWNYPFELSLWAIPAILLAGNTIVYKPSELSTETGILIGELFKLAGVPDGVLNIVQGDGTTGRYLLENPYITGISFTGSTKTGRDVFLSGQYRFPALSLEMGGSDFAIVLEDADLDITVPGIMWGAFTNAGQVCVSIEKVLVHKSIYDNFIERLVTETRKLRLGIDISPLISRTHKGKCAALIQSSITKGDKLLCGDGIVDSNYQKGNYMLPTIIQCNDKERLANTPEIFGPIIMVSSYETEEEAVSIVNASPYGLGCTLWTRNESNCSGFIKGVRAGMVWVNEVNLPMPQTPWIGQKISAWGCNLSKRSVYDAMNLKVVHVDESDATREWWYPYE